MLKQISGAIMLFDDMEFGSYSEAEHKAMKAFELYENGEISQALTELDAAIEINPANSSWRFDKALTLDTKGEFDEAITEYETALQLNPDDLEILNSLAVDYTRTGQYDRAIETFEHIQQLDPGFEPCYCNRIIAYTEMGQHDLAEQMFYLAQQLNPDCALCYYNIGNSLFVRGEYKKAIHCWQKTAKLEPSHPQINYRIAQAYWAEGDFKLGREYFLAELRINPGDVDVILDFGLFLLETGEVESAKEKFNRILELRPDFALAKFYLGEVTFNSGDYGRAVKLFKEALQNDNRLTGPHYRLAEHSLMTGQTKEARDHLVSEMKLAPEDTEILVSIGSMFIEAGDMDYAMHCLLKAADIDCSNADAYYYLGVVSAVKGRFKDSLEFFGHALDIKPRDVRALRDSAVVYLGMGRLAEAADRIKKALILAGDDSQLRMLDRRIRMAQAAARVTEIIDRFQPRFISRLVSRITLGRRG
ncbi:MAG: tetratricopeptide repeat protein [Sedimentisphaerales bacterium]|nr:tetratricopeptide repeat protein [Sedimentisphaerales bacterium]